MTAFKAVLLLALAWGVAPEGRERLGRGTGVLGRREVPDSMVVRGLAQFGAVFCGAVLTFLVSVEFNLGAVVASAFVGLLGATLVKRFTAPIFCGSFVGMCSTSVFAFAASATFLISSRLGNGPVIASAVVGQVLDWSQRLQRRSVGAS